ncbi:hypothetical protein [Blastochloris tepida]|uniref:hypothetical protein n=1 Tax=Blastochloris tepida TaxID=2233851 RepID=UPI000F849E47|nr:hypothetical protein [Blastochloris tepida]
MTFTGLVALFGLVDRMSVLVGDKPIAGLVGACRSLVGDKQNIHQNNELVHSGLLVGACRQKTSDKGGKNSMKSMLVACRCLSPYGGLSAPTSRRPHGRKAAVSEKRHGGFRQQTRPTIRRIKYPVAASYGIIYAGVWAERIGEA